jgi:hypothetical protein
MKWTNEQLEFLKDNVDVITKDEICNILDKSINAVNRMIRRLNLKEKVGVYWSDEEINILKENYSAVKIEDFAQLLNNRSKIEIMLKANKMGLKREKRNSENMRRYKVNEDYFKNIDNPNKAYYLGWAFTDGNVTTSNYSYQYRLRLDSKDKNILEKFLIDINSDTKIYARGSASEVNICSRIFVEHLINLDCTENKTKKLTFPSIKEEFLLDFIKGCFDGDGSYVCTDKTKKIHLVSASKEFVELLQLQLKLLGVHSNVYDIKTYYRLMITRKESMKIFLNLMLSTESDFLDRKRNKMIELLKYVS